MSKLTAGGITVGILAGLWVWLSASVDLFTTTSGFFAYASYYAAGGGVKGLKSSIITNLSGIFWAVMSVFLGSLLNNLMGVALMGIVLATMLCSACVVWQARFSMLGFVPGAFFGMTSYFASGNNLQSTVISMVAGGLIGYLSQISGDLLSDSTSKTAPVAEGKSN